MGNVLGYNMRMAEKKSTSLTDLSDLIRFTVKKAAIGHPLYTPGMYTKAVEEKQRADAYKLEQQKKQQQVQTQRYLPDTDKTGYSSLPNVAGDRAKAARTAAFDEWSKSQPITQRRSLEDTQRMARNFHDYGKSPIARRISGVLYAPVKAVADTIAAPVTYFNDAPKGTSFIDWTKNHFKTSWQDYGSEAADVARNFRLQGNAVRHGATSIANIAKKWGDPSSWKSGLEGELARKSHDNAAANDTDLYHEQQRLQMSRFNDRDLNIGRGKPTALGQWNYAGNSAIGEYTGGTAVTAGIGTAAKATSAGISAGLNAAKLGKIAPVVTYPLNVVGKLSTPVTSTAAGIKARVAQTGTALKQTGHDLMPILRHPLQATRQATQYARHHPFAAAGKAVSYPLTRGIQVASPLGIPAWMAYDVGSPMVNGRYSDAAKRLGGWATFGALSPYGLRWAIPGSIAYGLAAGDEQGE